MLFNKLQLILIFCFTERSPTCSNIYKEINGNGENNYCESFKANCTAVFNGNIDPIIVWIQAEHILRGNINEKAIVTIIDTSHKQITSIINISTYAHLFGGETIICEITTPSSTLESLSKELISHHDEEKSKVHRINRCAFSTTSKFSEH